MEIPKKKAIRGMMNHPENEIEKSKQIMRLTAPQFADQCLQ
jgi:hypothetical protein